MACYGDSFTFFFYFQKNYSPGVDFASNINEYRESSWGKSGSRVRLKKSRTSVRGFMENVGSSASHNLSNIHSLLQIELYFFA
jgi:hypothetical protein